MWQEDGDPLLKALANTGIDDILSLLILDEQQIDELKYDDNGTMTLLAPGHKNMVTIFLAYVCHHILIGNPIMDDYLSVMPEEFEAYCGNDYLKLMDVAPSKSTLHAAKNNPKDHDPVATFLKDIQHNLNTFPFSRTFKLVKETATIRLFSQP